VLAATGVALLDVFDGELAKLLQAAKAAVDIPKPSKSRRFSLILLLSSMMPTNPTPTANFQQIII
jgi:hypothetical protein